MKVKNLNTRRGLGDPSQHRFDNIDIKKVIDVWVSQVGRYREKSEHMKGLGDTSQHRCIKY